MKSNLERLTESLGSGLTRGRYELAKSGQTGKRFVQALRKVSLGLPLGDPARIVHVSE